MDNRTMQYLVFDNWLALKTRLDTTKKANILINALA